MRERLVRVEAAPGDPFDHGRFETVTEPLPEAPDSAPPTIQGQDEEPKVEVLSPEQWSGDPRFWSVDGDVLVGTVEGELMGW